jgi:hypothetical protein
MSGSLRIERELMEERGYWERRSNKQERKEEGRIIHT